MNQKNTEKATLPAVQKQIEAKNLVEKYRSQNYLVFVNEEDLHTQTMFLPEVVIVNSTPEEFHNINGRFMPKRHQTDRIGEAAGIVFLEENGGTRTEQVDGHTVYVGFAQAKKRLPDGTWKTSSICEYEFDPVKRVEEDVLRDKQGKYKIEKEKNLLLLTYQKFGRARASTGARLRVVRELTGMPTAIEAKDLKKAMVFCRIALNTDALLLQPELRDTAVKIALGAKESIYGPKQLEHQPQYEIEENGEETKEEITVPWDVEPKETEEEKQTREMIEDLQIRRKKYDEKLSEKAKAEIDGVLAQENPDQKTISGLVAKLDAWEELALAKGVIS